jgi:fumarylacetoacetase
LAGTQKALYREADSVNEQMNPTHDPERRSWVTSANRTGCAFPIQNLPFGVFEAGGGPTVGVAIGDQILNLHGCYQADQFPSLAEATREACAAVTLNPIMALGADCWSPLRARLSDLLRADHPRAADHERALQPYLLPMMKVAMLKPASIGNYTDFYASIDHATNVGRLFRPENPLLPNYKYVPIGYHGRASSIVVSGTAVRRPAGQFLPLPGEPPRFAPTQALDYELEVGFFVGPGNRLGEPIAIDRAAAHLFGICLLNDWSARDIQSWEYQPLGPFLAKSFATTISPWVVTMEALAPFRRPAFVRPSEDPAPLHHLDSEQDRLQGGIDLVLEVYLRSARMRKERMGAVRLSRGNLGSLYWTPAQLLTHHASNGCNLQPGDLFASGTVSGPEDHARGSLLEITRRGRDPIALPTGELRGFLEDGDEITLRGYCEREGFVSIGLGEVSGSITDNTSVL